MIKRRGGGNKELPILDPASPAAFENGNARRRAGKAKRAVICSPCSICLLVVTLLFFGIYVTLDNWVAIVHHGGKTTAGHAASYRRKRDHARQQQQEQDFHHPEVAHLPHDELKRHPLHRVHEHAQKLMEHAHHFGPHAAAEAMKKAQHLLNKKREIAAIEHLPHANAKESAELDPHADSSKLMKHAQNAVEESLHLKHHVHHDVVKMSELDQFPTLEDSLKKSKIVGLYFGASWCNECKAATEVIQKAFDDEQAKGNNILYTPNHSNLLPGTKVYPLSIVFVSSHPSDYTKEAFEKYGSSNWHHVPFNSEEQTKLKQHFHTCAEREAQELKVDRKFSVPHFIILDSETRKVMTVHGVHDVEEYGYGALNHWQELQRAVTGLHGKKADSIE
jgi:thiol-disulfide isomerase/thioredoxin